MANTLRRTLTELEGRNLHRASDPQGRLRSAPGGRTLRGVGTPERERTAGGGIR